MPVVYVLQPGLARAHGCAGLRGCCMGADCAVPVYAKSASGLNRDALFALL